MAKPSLLLLQRTKYIYHLAICILWGDRVAKKSKKKKNVILFSLPFRMNIMNHNHGVSFMTLPVRSQDESVTKLDRGARVRRGRAHLAPCALRRLATELTAAVPEFAAAART